ncbi:MAG: metallophosphoesterase [Nitrososphaerota archaeon]|nr:metallophosphoesterase [Candidatus Calditenuaceae archaeon]MDW8073031.1 metallophosphoesterase [Nitrososphaerota archaeon]
MRRISRRGFIELSLLGVTTTITTSLAAPFNYKLEVTKLEAGLGGRLAFLPDLHYHKRGEAHVEAALYAVLKLEPDVMVFGGDLVDEETVDFDGLDLLLRELEAKRGIAVMGNHEYWSGYVARAVSALKRSGFEVLFNEHAETPLGRLFGYDWRESRVYDAVSFDGIVVSHDPHAADSVNGEALVLAGHTHGGLVLSGLTLYSNSRYTRGLFTLKGGAVLYVSRGLGQMSLTPRINARPELLVLD